MTDDDRFDPVHIIEILTRHKVDFVLVGGYAAMLYGARRRHQRIMVIDGAMGTAIQRDRPDEAGYRGDRFEDWPTDLIGNNDLLTLTQPHTIEGIHREYLHAGADILETNTFNANAISLSDYDMAESSYELNFARAALARKSAGAFSSLGKPRYVAGAIGPTTRTASISPDVNDPGARNISYDQLVAAYLEAANGLVHGGSDLIIVETIFDSLNAKAALFAVETLFENRGRRWPVIISGFKRCRLDIPIRAAHRQDQCCSPIAGPSDCPVHEPAGSGYRSGESAAALSARRSPGSAGAMAAYWLTFCRKYSQSKPAPTSVWVPTPVAIRTPLWSVIPVIPLLASSGLITLVCSP
jgi:hypothetical protein